MKIERTVAVVHRVFHVNVIVRTDDGDPVTRTNCPDSGCPIHVVQTWVEIDGNSQALYRNGRGPFGGGRMNPSRANKSVCVSCTFATDSSAAVS